MTVVWIILSNVAFAGIIVRRLIDEQSLYRLLDTHMPWKHYSLSILMLVILASGIILELFNSEKAIFVNTGFFRGISLCRGYPS